eukprot:TRINITY_DN1799_c0_g1_i1.p2 TRINITY_DN1799_c0_g1~~TRINITY_DN1799_c0_g1_i1.p2  ORF type:complete len:182 (+),score=45.98 TRINITY_DN1799_c0_g1_i1:214-759(+)
MGVLLGRLMASLFGDKECKIVMIGLDNAGKTTILYALHLGEVVLTRPTIGSNVERVRYKNAQFVVWDLAGQAALRPTWEAYYAQTNAIILAVDSTDTERLPVVREELFHALEHHDLSGAPLLVFANKMDLPTALPPAALTTALGLHHITGHTWHAQACCALTGEGLEDGLRWVAEQLKLSA